MGGKWRETSLAELGPIVTGKTPSTKDDGFFGGMIPFITPSDMDGRRIIAKTGRYLTEAGAASVKNAQIPEGAVIVSCIGSDMGKAAIAAQRSVTNQQINSIVVESLNSSAFVYYNLSTRKAEIRGAAGGSAQPILNKTAFGRLPIVLPSPDEQRRIAAVLGALDDKIELNRKMNQTLETMAQALFKSWFVDFDPVIDNALRAGNPIPDDLTEKAARRKEVMARDSYSVPEYAGLFPDSFEDSELGSIPLGWTVRQLSNSTSYLRRGLSPKYTEDGGILVLNQKCVRNGEVNLTLGRRHDATKKRVDGRELEAGDVLVNSTGVGTLGRVGQIHTLPETVIVDSHVTVVRALENTTTLHFLGTLLLRLEPEIEALGEGSTGQTELSRARLGELPLVLPPIEAQRAFDQVVAPFLERQELNRSENAMLAGARDTLLPKLISGEIRVPTQEAIEQPQRTEATT